MAYVIEEFCTLVSVKFNDFTVVQAISAPAPYIAWLLCMFATAKHASISLHQDFHKLIMYGLFALLSGAIIYLLVERIRNKQDRLKDEQR